MKKKIAILGSTGSIGKITLNIINKDKTNFDVMLLTTNTNASKVFQQSKKYKVKNVLIANKEKYILWKKKFKNKNINLFNNFDDLDKLFKRKLDYTINAISGIDGLKPTIKIIKLTRKIAIANKESIICGWNLIKKELIKNNTEFVPVDSEHFSIHELIKNYEKSSIKKITITASGGPFLRRKSKKKITITDALKHPNWSMGKKITIDSSTLMNKVFEVIEAKKIFNINLSDINILINPNSYIHAIVTFNNGIIKILSHETKMDIPIFNSIYDKSKNIKINTKDLNLYKINNIDLSKPKVDQFKVLNILKLIPKKDSLFETILITINDELVEFFLNKKIEYKKISTLLLKIINFKSIKKYCNVRPKSVDQVYKIRDYAKKIVRKYV